MMKIQWSIPKHRFNNGQYIDCRVEKVTEQQKIPLQRALRYLYARSAGKNITRAKIKPAWQALEPAERIVIHWLQTRTNGKLRWAYGHPVAAEAKSAKFRCRACGQGDVRTLQLDHVKGRKIKVFRCLCANCHQIKSRRHNWQRRLN